jgi:hypothetical protein
MDARLHQESKEVRENVYRKEAVSLRKIQRQNPELWRGVRRSTERLFEVIEMKTIKHRLLCGANRFPWNAC